MVRAKAKAKTKSAKVAPSKITPPKIRLAKSPAAAIKGPAHYKNLTALRGAIDAMDDILLPLLAKRLKLVASAARF